MILWCRIFYDLTLSQLEQKRVEYPAPPHEHLVTPQGGGRYKLQVCRYA